MIACARDAATNLLQWRYNACPYCAAYNLEQAFGAVGLLATADLSGRARRWHRSGEPDPQGPVSDVSAYGSK